MRYAVKDKLVDECFRVYIYVPMVAIVETVVKRDQAIVRRLCHELEVAVLCCCSLDEEDEDIMVKKERGRTVNS